MSADTNKVRVTFPEASAIAEEVGGCCSSWGAVAAAAGCLSESQQSWSPSWLLSCPLPLCMAPDPSWLAATLLACPVQVLKTEFDSARILYNRFVSAIAQKPTIATVLSPDVSSSTLPAAGGCATVLLCRCLSPWCWCGCAVCAVCAAHVLTARCLCGAGLCRLWSAQQRQALPLTSTRLRGLTGLSCSWTWQSSSWRR